MSLIIQGVVYFETYSNLIGCYRRNIQAAGKQLAADHLSEPIKRIPGLEIPDAAHIYDLLRNSGLKTVSHENLDFSHKILDFLRFFRIFLGLWSIFSIFFPII